MTDYIVVLVTCSNAREARRIAQAVVERRLAACVNVLDPPVTSVFRWKGKVQRARETLLLLKSSKKRLVALRAAIRQLHSYDVPELIALPIAAGSPAYLRWLGVCLRAPGRTRPRKKK